MGDKKLEFRKIKIAELTNNQKRFVQGGDPTTYQGSDACTPPPTTTDTIGDQEDGVCFLNSIRL